MRFLLMNITNFLLGRIVNFQNMLALASYSQDYSDIFCKSHCPVA